MKNHRQKLQISSLQAAICNVALFKSMKEKQFKDQISVLYSEEGVVIEASSERQWKKAISYVNNFLSKKKIGPLCHGYDRDIYEQLIGRGLKDYTRRIKEQSNQCPYINIIHYQKLRKSCDYMAKQKYIQPLKEWDRKQKLTPNFAFLIVDPADKFQEVKANLLESLLKRPVTLQIMQLTVMQFVGICLSAQLGSAFKTAFSKKLIETGLDKEKNSVRLVNYSEQDYSEWEFKVLPAVHYNCSRLVLEHIMGRDVESQMATLKQFLRLNKNDANLFVDFHQQTKQESGGEYIIVIYNQNNREKTNQALKKIQIRFQSDPKQVKREIHKRIVCSIEQIQFVTSLGRSENGAYQIHKACIRSCPFMLHQYNNISTSEKQSFSLYLEQLCYFNCTYLVRFYGIAVRTTEEGEDYFLVFDYHPLTLKYMREADMILDNFQVANIVLQIAYLAQMLQSNDESRCLGPVFQSTFYWPPAIVLPYLPLHNSKALEEDVKILGNIFNQLLLGEENQQDQYFSSVVKLMLKEQKSQRISLTKCIHLLQQLLMIQSSS